MMGKGTKPVGLGGDAAAVRIYLPNPPPQDEYQNLQALLPLSQLAVAELVAGAGNHWRKIVNLAAKIGFQQNPRNCSSWQVWRDSVGLTADSDVALLFSSPVFDEGESACHYISGWGHAAELGLAAAGEVSTCGNFRVDRRRRLIVGPYLDYRQLSNQKVAALGEIVSELNP